MKLHHEQEVSIDIIRCGVRDVQCQGFFISDLYSLMLQQKFNIDCGRFEQEVYVVSEMLSTQVLSFLIGIL
jgi:hypothetical protein